MLLLLAGLATALSPLTDDDENPYYEAIKGVGYMNEEDRKGVNYLSMAGGATVMIQGQRMAIEPPNNIMKMTQDGVKLVGNAVSENDAFNSNSAGGVYGYTTPSAMDLFNMEWHQFDGVLGPIGDGDELKFELEVDNAEQTEYVTCVSATACVFHYKRDYTPMLIDVTPSQVYAGQEMQFHVNAKYAHDTNALPKGQPQVRDMRIGGYIVDGTEYNSDDDRLNSFSRDDLTGIVGDQPPSKDAPANVLFRVGYAQPLDSMTHCNFAGDECWTVRTHPKIESISATEGYTNGGQDLTISGHGFNGTDVSVTVDGVDCVVKTQSSDEIVCVTGAADADSVSGSSRPGQSGVKHQLVDPEDENAGVSYSSLTDGTHPVAATTLLTSFETLHTSVIRSGRVLSTWFTAPQTGNYRFYMSCDD